MSAEVAGRKRRWAASVAGALVAAGAVIALLRVPQAPLQVGNNPMTSKPPLELTKTGSTSMVLKEEMVMNDQTPLFLPTEWNVTLPSLRRPEVGQSVLDQDALKMTFGEADLKLGLESPVNVSAKPAEVLLSDPVVTPVAGFGRLDLTLTPLPARGAFVEVRTVDDNRQVFGDRVTDALPPAGKVWRPMEFLAAVDAAGLVGALVITERSDAEEIDNYFRKYLARTFQIGERLPPGVYRVIVGP